MFFSLYTYGICAIKYLPTKTDDSTTNFGATYKGLYRWLGNSRDTSVVLWFSQQANLTNFVLTNLNGRDGLVAEWKQLDLTPKDA